MRENKTEQKIIFKKKKSPESHANIHITTVEFWFIWIARKIDKFPTGSDKQHFAARKNRTNWNLYFGKQWVSVLCVLLIFPTYNYYMFFFPVEFSFFSSCNRKYGRQFHFCELNFYSYDLRWVNIGIFWGGAFLELCQL